MEQEDYLKKQIDIIGKVIGKILSDLLNLRSTGQFAQGIEITAKELKEKLNLDLSELTSLPPEETIQKLEKQQGFSINNLENLGDLLYALSDNSIPGRVSVNKKMIFLAYHIYNYCNIHSTVYSFERNKKIKLLQSAL